MKLRKFIGLVFFGMMLLLVTGVAWWLYFYNYGESPFESTDSSATKSSPSSTVGNNTPNKSSVGESLDTRPISAELKVNTWQAIPAIGVPLRESIGSLTTAAESGNHVAACRLGMELQSCTAFFNDVEDLEEEASKIGLTFRANSKNKEEISRAWESFRNENPKRYAQMLQSKAQVALRCMGMAEELKRVKPAWEYFLLAAKHGNLHAMRSIGIGDLKQSPFEAIKNPEMVKQYTQHASAFLHEAASLGDVDSAFALAQSYAHFYTSISSQVSDPFLKFFDRTPKNNFHALKYAYTAKKLSVSNLRPIKVEKIDALIAELESRLQMNDISAAAIDADRIGEAGLAQANQLIYPLNPDNLKIEIKKDSVCYRP